MSTDLIRYDLLVQDALRGVVRNVLSEAARNGLQGEHHFFITFKTTAPGLRLSNLMRERYPDEMTIILQHQFWDLGVTEHAFEVGLSFSNKPERLLIPFAAITSFVDPSVQFGLKFEVQDPDGPAREAGASSVPDQMKVVPNGRMLSTVEPVQAIAPPARGTEPKFGKPTLAKTSAKDPDPLPKPDARPDAKSDIRSGPKPDAKPTSPTKGEEAAKSGDGKAGDGSRSGDGPKVVSIDAFRKKP